MPKEDLACSHRIALVINGFTLAGHRLLSGLCQRATVYPNLQVRRFFEDTLAREGIDRLLRWEPEAVVLYFSDTRLLRDLRDALPHAPMVAMGPAPLDLVDGIVAASADEIIRASIDHFSANGLSHFALFYADPKAAADIDARVFRHLLEGCSETFDTFQRDIPNQELLRAPKGESMQRVGAWLQALPRPIGVYCPVDHSAAYLVRICRQFDLSVPGDVQVIGCDELDESLESFPHITSVHIPSERIGATALRMTIDLLRGHKLDPTVQLVNGSSLVPQGSTGRIPSQLSNIPAAIAYIESHATRGATVDEVVQQTQSVSRMTFYRDFKDYTGDSPAAYIRNIRIETACRLLSTTPMEITRVAELCGFSGSNYFAQIFRREIGMTPNQYRQSRAGKKE